MDKSKKLTLLQTMLVGEEFEEDVLDVYLELAGQKVLNRMYPYKDDYTGLEVPDRYVNVQLKVCVAMLSKIGAEAQIQHIENGIHRNYGSADVPDGILQEVVPYCQAIR